MLPALLLAALLALGTAGCGSDSDSDAGGSGSDVGSSVDAGDETDPEAGDESSYVTAVNARCTELEDAIYPITGGGAPTLKEFREDQPELKKLVAAFDADIAKIPVPPGEQATADALAAFQKLSDRTYDDLIAAADTGDEKKFEKAFAVFLEAFNQTSVDEDLEATGILCPAR